MDLTIRPQSPNIHAMRKVTVSLTVKLQITVNEGVEVSEVINEMDTNFDSATDGADITDWEIVDHDVTDSH